MLVPKNGKKQGRCIEDEVKTLRRDLEALEDEFCKMVGLTEKYVTNGCTCDEFITGLETDYEKVDFFLWHGGE